MTAKPGLRYDSEVAWVLDEVLYSSSRTRVTRISRAGGRLIAKQALGPGALERTRHERRILARLDGARGVLRLTPSRGDDEILMADVGGRTLAAMIDTLRPDVLTSVGIGHELALVVAGLHRAGVVHSDINPGNIIIPDPREDGAWTEPVLIDFHLATTFVEGVREFAHPREIVGTLPYLAPEQTGRTGTPADERADLYGLGASLYELCTGAPPFPVGDPLEMIRDTLTRTPAPLTQRDSRIPRQLCDIVMRLLEKDPDRRYQSAEGLAADLSRVRSELQAGRESPFDLGQRDFPRRLSPPSRLVGREEEILAQRRAFEAAVAGGGRGHLVAGPSGVGKTALVNELRSVVTAAEGWFVTGKFDQYRPDAEAGAIIQALRSLSRLLLAGTDADVAAVQARILAEVGSNLPLLWRIPELRTLLGTVPQPDPQIGEDAETMANRWQQALVSLFRAVASPRRPVVMVIDDLQWAGAASIGLLNALLTEDRLPGLLLVGAYREAEIDAAHPLTAALRRWQQLGAVSTQLRLANLAPTALGELLGEMLRLAPERAQALANAVGERTDGNPFDTVELVNALRRDGALWLASEGWQWDEAGVRQFVGRGDVLDLLSARIEVLPGPAREVIEVVACLGGEVKLELLRIASGLPIGRLNDRLLASLEDGLLVLERGAEPAVRFRHDRVQQAVHRRLDGTRGCDLRLAVARRLAAAPEAPEAQILAAEQYLHCGDALSSAPERRVAARLFVAAATKARLVSSETAERFLAAATASLATGPNRSGRSAEEEDLLAAADRLRHAVLISLGRLPESDLVFDRILEREPELDDLVVATCDQIISLCKRGQWGPAIDLGLTLLTRFGIDVPDAGYRTLDWRYDELATWAAGLDLATEIARPEPDDPRLRMTATLLSALSMPAFLGAPHMTSWLFLTGQRLWSEFGLCAPLVGCLIGAIHNTVQHRDDYRTGHTIGYQVLSIATARNYQPEASFSWSAFLVMGRHWFEPLDQSVPQMRAAQEEMVRSGDLQGACRSYQGSFSALLECAPTLDSSTADIELGLAFAARIGDERHTAMFLPMRQLGRALRGRTDTPGSFNDEGFEETAGLASLTDSVLASACFHVYRALCAAVFDDMPGLISSAEAVTPMLSQVSCFYVAALGQLLRGLSLAERVRAALPAQRRALLADLDSCQDYLAARAADAPTNFGHLLTWLTAERARAVGDYWAAARNFDTARDQAASVNRPWHLALITERAGRFHLAEGLPATGRDLLAEADRRYAAWCADGKVDQLRQEFPFLDGAVAHSLPVSQGQDRLASMTVSGQGLDLMAILRSSQALSSETSLDGLRARVGEVLRAMTGATGVLIVLREDESRDWRVWDTTGEISEGIVLREAADQLPLAAFRYVERTGEPLLVPDLGADERFTVDPFVAGQDRCSLLVIPLPSPTALRAVVVLTNTQRIRAFAGGGLQALRLVTGQLTVALDNAQLYESLERKVAERTVALEQANVNLEMLSTTDALTGVPNRRHFDAALATAWEQAAQLRHPLSLVMVDVDRFKLYNDHYGHVAGDECLRVVATALQSGLRDRNDVLCRYGGEEFAIILAGTDASGSLLVAERARAAVADLQKPHTGADGATVTISLGVATYVPDAIGEGSFHSIPDLIAAADGGLYQAKRDGRNRVRSARG